MRIIQSIHLSLNYRFMLLLWSLLQHFLHCLPCFFILYRNLFRWNLLIRQIFRRRSKYLSSHVICKLIQNLNVFRLCRFCKSLNLNNPSLKSDILIILSMDVSTVSTTFRMQNNCSSNSYVLLQPGDRYLHFLTQRFDICIFREDIGWLIFVQKLIYFLFYLLRLRHIGCIQWCLLLDEFLAHSVH